MRVVGVRVVALMHVAIRKVRLGAVVLAHIVFN